MGNQGLHGLLGRRPGNVEGELVNDDVVVPFNYADDVTDLSCISQQYDATQLILSQGPITQPILIDQGLEDNFLHDKQLIPEAFEAACSSVGQKVTLRMQVSTRSLTILFTCCGGSLTYVL